MAASIAAAAWAAISISFWFISSAKIDPLVKAETDRKDEYRQIVATAALEQIERTTTSINETQAQIVEASTKLENLDLSPDSPIIAAVDKWDDLNTKIDGLSTELDDFGTTVAALKLKNLPYGPFDHDTIKAWFPSESPIDPEIQKTLDILGNNNGWVVLPVGPFTDSTVNAPNNTGGAK